MNKILIIRRLYNDYTKKHIKKILFSIFLSLIVAGSTSSIAWLLDPAIKKLFIEKDQSLILVIPALIILAFFSKGTSLYFAKIIMIRVGEEVRKTVQSDMLKTLVNADSQLIDNKHSGKFIANITNDVQMITSLISTAILNFFKDTLTLVGLLAVMFFQNWQLSLIAIIMIPLATYAAKNLGKRISKVSTEAMVKVGFFMKSLTEMFKNHKIIKIFQKEEYEIQRMEEVINELKEKNIKISAVFHRASPIMEALTGIMIASLIFYSGKLILNDQLNINNFFSFLAAMMLAYQPVRSLATLNMTINQGLASAERILPIIDIKNEIKENINDEELLIKNGNINFKDIVFKYVNSENEILKKINLEIAGGKMTALVGHSGAGKSTILNLIPRFFDRTSGDINIDGQSIYKTKIFSLRKHVSLVSQDTTLFDDTIFKNISYADPKATMKDIEEVSKNSYASEFINKLPNKYETIIGENGVRLSGGEKQRLSIARAMLKKSSIVLLDEATSSLDSETEDKIQKAINLLIQNRTTIVIAHRLSTILNSDKIYVIDNGKIAAEGDHKHLLSNSPIYRNFYEKQVKKN
jgi:subfamily B ATP-binding cassette protein MsbA